MICTSHPTLFGWSESEMDFACCRHGKQAKCVQDLGGEFRAKETACKT